MSNRSVRKIVEIDYCIHLGNLAVKWTTKDKKPVDTSFSFYNEDRCSASAPSRSQLIETIGILQQAVEDLGNE